MKTAINIAFFLYTMTTFGILKTVVRTTTNKKLALEKFPVSKNETGNI